MNVGKQTHDSGDVAVRDQRLDAPIVPLAQARHKCLFRRGAALARGHHRPVESAQETFKRMMREQVAPQLRALGFKGSGQRFTLPSDSHWALLGFQRSAWGDSRKGKFTINLTVVSKD